MDVDAHLAALSARIEVLNHQVEYAFSATDADPEHVERLLGDLRKVEDERSRLRSEFLTVRRVNGVKQEAPPMALADLPPTGASRSVRMLTSDPLPIRERVLVGLDLLGVPAAARTVADAAAVRTDLEVEARQLASLRRAEQASWVANPDRRPAYVVPALSHRRFEPVRGQLASSSWELSRRIIGPLSPRADHLRATINLARNLEWLVSRGDTPTERLEGLLWRHARSVPGALNPARKTVDPERVIVATQAELELVDEQDRAEREESAARAAKLDRRSQLFGAGLRAVNSESRS
jgi:hypothetical protein